MLKSNFIAGLLGFFVSLFALVAPAAGQASTASIIGAVTDTSGGVLPGVNVTATGPALQVPSVVGMTDAKGEYRLSPLPLRTNLDVGASSLKEGP